MSKKPIKRERERLPPPKVDKPGEQPVIATPEKYGARPSKAATCKACGHAYLKPCNDNEKRKADCANWNFLLQQKKAKKK